MSSTSPVPFTVQQVMIGAESTVGTAAAANDMKTTNVHPFDYSGLEAVALENRRAHMRGVMLKPFVGKRTGRITLSQDFHGWSSSSPTAAPTVSDAPATPSAHPLLDYLGALLGNRKADGYQATADLTGSTTSLLKISDASGGLSNMSVGHPVLIDTSDTSKPYEVLWLQDIDTSGDPDVGTLVQTAAFADTSASATVWGAITAYHVAAGSPFWANGTIKAYTIQLFGADSDAKHTLKGCMPIGGSLVLTAGEMPQLDLEWGVSHWDADSSGGNPADVDYNDGDVGSAGNEFPDAEPFVDAWVTLSDASAPSAASQIRVQDLRIDFNVEAVEIRDPAGESGVCGYAISKRNPTISFTVYREYAEEVADWLNGTEKCFSFQHGSQPGKIIAGIMPECFHVQHPTYTNVDDLIGSQIVIGAGPYADDTGSRVDSAPINQAFRLAVL